MNKKQFCFENLSKIPGIAFDEEKYSPNKKIESNKTSKTESVSSIQAI